MKRNIVIPALEDVQRAGLRTLRKAEEMEFHSLLDVETLVEPDSLSFDALLDRAREELDRIAGSVDAIIAQWDFPTSVLVPILCRERGLPAPSLESVLKCEHKYWSRIEQQRSIPEVVPKFCSIDPFAEDPVSQLTIGYPFWLKPVKAFASQLGFRIMDEAEFRDALATIREGIRHFGEPFNEALAHVQLPPEIAPDSGNTCIAEQLISGVQGAPEGTVFQGEFNVHGVIDQPKEEIEATWDRLEYPSGLPEAVQHRMIQTCRRFLEHIGFDNGCFNAEFMWDESEDQLWLIEFNTRISQSHSEMFVMVDGMSNHEVAIDIACGERPAMPNRMGRFPVAAKCIIPHEHRDGVVTRVPGEEEIAALAQRFPGTKVRLDVAPGTRLSELPNQESFAYHLGTLYLGADSHEQIGENYRACLKALRFDITSVEDDDRQSA